MLIINTAEFTEDSVQTLNADHTSWVYNALDCCVTADVYNNLIDQLNDEPENVRETYEFALKKLAPFMEMELRGTRINEKVRRKSIVDITKTISELDRKLQRMLVFINEQEENPKYYFNWNSHIQLKQLFYGRLNLKVIRKRNTKGIFAPTVDESALEHFAANYYYVRPVVRLILVLKDLRKQLGFLKTEIDPDRRMRTSYNLAGTNTGRLSSAMNDFGTGTNLQNADRRLRYPFEADKDMYMVNIDLEQADGRNVGAVCWNLFIDMPREEIYELAKDDKRLKRYVKNGEWIGPVGEALAGKYLDACEGGDLHTTVCKMVWPNDLKGEAWPDEKDLWKKFCDSRIAHGQDSFRQLSKKGGHGTNYYGTPRTMSKHLHMPTKVIANFQGNYFYEFPAIPLWHNWVIKQIKETGQITTLFGRRRVFFDRGNDPATHRKAIAYEPQSCTGEQIDRGLYQIWKAYPQIQLLNQVHDSILLQLPFTEHAELIPQILKTMQVPLTLKKGRQFIIPLDAAGGWNWGYAGEDNPYGLKGWKGKETRIAPKYVKRKRNLLREVL